MAFKDILLVLITYPQATDAAGIQEAVSFAVALERESLTPLMMFAR